jgi:protein SCO1
MIKKIALYFSFCAAVLVGCAPTPPVFTAIDITGAAGYATDFKLTDHTGKSRTLKEFQGKVVALFFGFTQCPEICPGTMLEMKQVRQALGADADKLQVLFITLDPKRDTPAVLSQYVPAFDPSFLGLHGTEAEIAKVAKDFKIFWRVQESANSSNYTLDHTASTLIFDTQSRLRLFANMGTPADKISADIQQLLKGK